MLQTLRKKVLLFAIDHSDTVAMWVVKAKIQKLKRMDQEMLAIITRFEELLKVHRALLEKGKGDVQTIIAEIDETIAALEDRRKQLELRLALHTAHETASGALSSL